jgi:predicted nucleotidyltransferase
MSSELRLRELIDRLVEADVRFVIVGGLAVSAWGHVRGTQDVDLVPDPDPANLERLAQALVELDGRVETREGRLAASAIRTFRSAGDRTLVSTELGQVDVLQGHHQVPTFEELDATAVSVELGEIPVRVCSLEALLGMKRQSQRHLDRADLEALEAAHAETDDEG